MSGQEIASAGFIFVCQATFLYLLRSLVNYLPLGDLGATPHLTRSDTWIFWFPVLYPVVFGLGAVHHPGWTVPVLIGLAVVQALLVLRWKPVAPQGWSAQPADPELTQRVLSLARVGAARPRVLIASYRTGAELMSGKASIEKPAVIIPRQFALEAPADEIVALSARQLVHVRARDVVLIIALLMFAFVLVTPIALAIGHPVVSWSSAIAFAFLAFLAVFQMPERAGLAMDRDAIALTGQPESYRRAIQRARSIARAGRRPWWFRPESLSARVAAIERTFHLHSN